MRLFTKHYTGILACILLVATAVKADYYPLKLVNNTGKTNGTIHPYIIFMAQDTTTAANFCVLKLTYDSTRKAQVGKLVRIGQHTDSRKYSYRIDSLQGYDTAKKSVNIFIPNTISGRCMISLNYKLYMPPIPSDTGSSQWVFQSPSVNDTGDVSYDIIYDKFEFTYNKKNVFYIDPTAVDFFAIPIGLSSARAGSSGAANAKRNKLMQKITQTLNDSINNKWNTLVIKHDTTILRVTAPNLAPAFDTSYLTQSSYNYIDSLIKYYKTHTVKINCKQLDVAGDEIYDKYNVLPTADTGAYIFTSSPIVGGLWIFKNNPKTTTGSPIIDTIDMNTVNSNNFFGPGTAPFLTVNKTVMSIIVESITAAFTVGLLPAPDSMTLDSAYISNTAVYPYYKKNTYLKASQGKGPWYNLYTKALHKAIPQIYAFAYDDVLGQSGTLVSGDKTDTITVTLGDMGNIAIPRHSSLLPVLADTLVYNSGFVHIGNQYVDTLRWKLPVGQPANAKYFFMGSGPEFTIPPKDFLSFQYGHFFSATDTMGWISIPDSLITGNCTNTLIPITVNTCGGPGNPCPTDNSNWTRWMNSSSSNILPGVDNVVFPVVVTSYSQLSKSGSNYTATISWQQTNSSQPANAKYFFFAGGVGFLYPPDSMVKWQVASGLYSAQTTTGTLTLPAAALDTSKLDSVTIQVFTCGGPGHPCPTATSISKWQCDEGSDPMYPTSLAAKQQAHKRKKK